jgi:GNAT superfamily N-acetyltransferase
LQFVDLRLAKRLEMSTAVTCKECAEAVAVLDPAIGAATDEIAGGIVAFTGVDSPVTQALGAGLNGPVTDAELDRLENFFFSRGAAVAIELCPFADRSLVELIAKRPYRLEEFSNVLVRELREGEGFVGPVPGVACREAAPGEAQMYARLVAEGFDDTVPVTQALINIVEAFFRRGSGQCFLTFVEGQAAGGGSVAVSDGIAELYGTSTLARFRGRGAQTALLNARMTWAVKRDCQLATTTTAPGTTSQRNFERAGFRVVYSRTKMIRRPG